MYRIAVFASRRYSSRAGAAPGQQQLGGRKPSAMGRGGAHLEATTPATVARHQGPAAKTRPWVASGNGANWPADPHPLPPPAAGQLSVRQRL